MHPLIRDGDLIEVTPIGASAVRVGDVILYRSGRGHMLAHRVVKVSARRGQVALLTRGSLVSSVEQSVGAGQVLGRVVAVQRVTGRMRLDTGTHRLISVLWARLSSGVPWLYSGFCKALGRVRRLAGTNSSLSGFPP
jgi:hypothetical protein